MEQAVGVGLDTSLAVVEERSGHVAILPDTVAVGTVFGLTDDLAGAVGSQDGAADLIEMAGLCAFGFVHLVKQAEAIDVVGFGAVGVMADQEAAKAGVGVDHIARGAVGVARRAAHAFGIVGVGSTVGVRELVAGVVAEVDECERSAGAP